MDYRRCEVFVRACKRAYGASRCSVEFGQWAGTRGCGAGRRPAVPGLPIISAFPPIGRRRSPEVATKPLSKGHSPRRGERLANSWWRGQILSREKPCVSSGRGVITGENVPCHQWQRCEYGRKHALPLVTVAHTREKTCLAIDDMGLISGRIVPCLAQERMEGGKNGLLATKERSESGNYDLFPESAACVAEPLGFLELPGDACGGEVCLFSTALTASGRGEPPRLG